MQHQIPRRSFLKQSGAGLMTAATSNLWAELLGNNPGSPLTHNFFEEKFGITTQDMKTVLATALSKGGDFSELFFEYRTSNSVTMEEGIIKTSSESISVGVGIRVLNQDQTGYAYTNLLDLKNMKRAALTAAAIANTGNSNMPADLTVSKSELQVYDLQDPLASTSLPQKIDLITAAYKAAESYDSRIEKISTLLADELQYVTIANSEGLLISDIRPQVRLMTSTVANEKGKRTDGFASGGGRIGLSYFQMERTPEIIGKESAKEAITLLDAVDPTAGEFPVVLGAHQSGVMIHEAVGHPLEADSNRKKTSIMWDKMGQMVASPLITIYDDPTIPFARGSMNVDDEGTVPVNTPLIEKGKLVGLLQDKLSAELMNMEPNGHGRRQTYKDYPIPRMCNTMLGKGDSDPEEIIGSVKKGFYAHSYAGGMVQDSGKFTFTVNLGYEIENGKLGRPVQNTTLIGTNVQILTEVDMVGNDMGIFLGTCGKDGQRAPCTAGTPTLKIKKMTLGGRA